MARIGLVQTGAVGDVFIALPIATAFADQGHTVFWPVNAAYLGWLEAAAPWVNFIPVPLQTPGQPREEEFFDIPQAELAARECDAVHVLYSAWERPGRVQNERISHFLKFDEYKYAVCGIPFREKWNLRLQRDRAREEAFFSSLGVRRDFICIHRTASNFTAQIALPEEWQRDYDMVEIDNRGTIPDWITTLERAAKLVMVDSSFANLVEQLNLPNEKYLMLRAGGLFTPVYRNGWNFL